MTNRELYFEEIKHKNSKFTKALILACLRFVNGFNSDADLYNHFDNQCQNTESYFYMRERIKKDGYPLQYLTHQESFYAMTLYVDARVLIPRPETEELVFKTIERLGSKFKENEKINALDIGTGSGCIALAIKKMFRNANVDATDISGDAIDVATVNSKVLGLDINLVEADMCDPSPFEKKYDVIISNPPYILKERECDKNVIMHEPKSALLADPPVKYYKAIIANYAKNIKKGTLLAFEISPKIRKEVVTYLSYCFPTSKISVEKDIYHRYRHVFVEVNDTPLDIDGIARAISEHKPICFPTETVSGLGVVAGDDEAFNNLVALKERSEDKPFTLMLSDKKEIGKYAYINKTAEAIINEFMPGPITLLLPLKNKYFNSYVNDSNVIGVRVPNYDTALHVLEAVGVPMFVTSANVSGKAPCTKVKECQSIFKDRVFYVLEDALGEKPSLVLDVTNDTIKVVREGDSDLLSKINEKVK